MTAATEVLLADALSARKDLNLKATVAAASDAVGTQRMIENVSERISIDEPTRKAVESKTFTTPWALTEEFDFHNTNLAMLDAAIQNANWAGTVEVDKTVFGAFTDPVEPGKTVAALAVALLRRKALKLKIGQLQLMKANLPAGDNLKRTDVGDKFSQVTGYFVKIKPDEVQAELDFTQKQLRLLDGAIQQANWSQKLKVPSRVLMTYSEYLKIDASQRGAASTVGMVPMPRIL